MVDELEYIWTSFRLYLHVASGEQADPPSPSKGPLCESDRHLILELLLGVQVRAKGRRLIRVHESVVAIPCLGHASVADPEEKTQKSGLHDGVEFRGHCAEFTGSKGKWSMKGCR